MRLSKLLSASISGAAVLAAVTVPVAEVAAEPVTHSSAVVEDGARFTTTAPVRVLDTRNGTGGRTGPLGAGSSFALSLTGKVPANATAVVLNLTGVNPTAGSFVTVWPDGAPRPTASNLNLVAGQTAPNLVTVALGAGSRVALYNNTGSVHLLADLAGYYAPGAGAGYGTLEPERVLDTRDGTGGSTGPLGAGSSFSLSLAGKVPAGATAVVLNLTGVSPTAGTFVTAWPDGGSRPTASNLNLVAGQIAPNLVTVALGAGSRVALYNNTGSVHLLADLAGYYAPGTGAVFVSQPPARVLDTRTGLGGGATAPLGAGSSLTLDLAPKVPTSAITVVANLTGVLPTKSTFVTAWPNYTPRPLASNLNLSSGATRPNHAILGLGMNKKLDLYNANGATHLIMDLAGYFAMPAPDCADRCVYAWGHLPALGNGTTCQDMSYYSCTTKVPVATSTPTDITAVTSGNATGYGLRSNGTVLAWGTNNHGNLGNGTSCGSGGPDCESTVPVQVSGLTGVVAIAAAGSVAYALKTDGTVWGWGWGLLGGMGTGCADPCVMSTVPIRIQGLANVTAIAGGQDTAYALRTDGTVWAWGGNHDAQLGRGLVCDSDTGDGCWSSTPAPVTGLTDVTAITGDGWNGYALRADGTVWSWGGNYMGELGNGTVGENCYFGDPKINCHAPTPVQVAGLTSVTAISGKFALKANGTIWAWGSNQDGELGSGTTCPPSNIPCHSTVPVQVAGINDAIAIAGKYGNGYAIRADHTVWAWGDNIYAKLGNGTRCATDPSTPCGSNVPTPVLGLTNVTAISAGGNTYAIVDETP